MPWTLGSVTRPLSSAAQPLVALVRPVTRLIPGIPWYGWGAVVVGAAAILLSARAAGATEATGPGAQRPDGLAPMLKEGASGPWVSYLQVRLGITATGTFDAETDTAVRTFQTANGLTVDGIVGSGTWTALGVDPVHNAPPAPPPGGGGGPGPSQPPAQPPPPGPVTPPAPPTTGNPFGLSDTIPQRESQILAHIADGNVEHQWWPLDYTTKDGHQVHLLVSRRALALNNGSDKLIVNATMKTEQKIADMIGGHMLTTRISDEIWKAAQKKLGIINHNDWVSDGTMASTKHMYDQSNILEQKVGGSGGLVANEGKDWILTRHFWQPPEGLGPTIDPATKKPRSIHNSANYGWYGGTSKTPANEALVIQGVGMAHDMSHSDYSQLQRFVQSGSLTIDGVPWDWGAALADPTVSKYIQDEGGTIPSPRHPDL